MRASAIVRCPQGKMGGRGLFWKKPVWNDTRKANYKERLRQVQSVDYFLRKHNNNDRHRRMPKRKLYEDYTAIELPWYDLRAKVDRPPLLGEGFHLPSSRALRHQLRPIYTEDLYTKRPDKTSCDETTLLPSSSLSPSPPTETSSKKDATATTTKESDSA